MNVLASSETAIQSERALSGRQAVQASPKLLVRWARCEEEVRQAQRLRYRVFSEEMGACLDSQGGGLAGVDADAFDPFCDHLLVKVALADGDEEGELVGTYRVLPPGAARRAGGLYIDTEFDIAALAALRPTAVELGRSCVHPEFRSGGVILALWAALCEYMSSHGLQTMIGCASIGLKDGPTPAVRLWHALQGTYLAHPQWQVRPWTPLEVCQARATAAQEVSGHDDKPPRHVDIPPLIKGYLRCGARLLGPPALDSAFNTADLPMMLRIQDFAPRYRKHFFGH